MENMKNFLKELKKTNLMYLVIDLSSNDLQGNV